MYYYTNMENKKKEGKRAYCQLYLYFSGNLAYKKDGLEGFYTIKTCGGLTFIM